MIIRNLDENRDWVFGKGKQDYLQNDAAILLNVQTRLREFRNDCFFNQSAGVDYISLLSTPGTRPILDQQIRSVIVQSDGVYSLDSFDTILDSTSRTLTVNAIITTVNNPNVILGESLNF